MRREITRKGNNVKGFTLLEMMIVVAIIAVLVVISIPVFTGVLEKSREATDLANVPSAYAEVMIAAIQEDTSSMYYVQATNSYEKKVELTQKIHGWDISSEELVIGGISSSDTEHWKGTPTKNGTCTIIYDNSDGEVTLKWSGHIISVGKQWSDSNGVMKVVDYSEISSTWPASAIEELVSAKVGQALVVNEFSKDKYPYLYESLQNGDQYEVGIYMINEKGQEMTDTQAITILGSSETKIDLTPSKYSRYYNAEASEGVENMKLGITFFKVKSGRGQALAISQEEAEDLSNVFEITD